MLVQHNAVPSPQASQSTIFSGTIRWIPGSWRKHYPVIGEHERGSQRPGMQSEEVSVQETVSRTYRSQVPARVGLLGNPSDGFKGKTLSLLIKNFCATVELRVHDNPADNTIEIVPHARFDRFNYNGSFFIDSIIYSRSHSICYRYWWSCSQYQCPWLLRRNQITTSNGENFREVMQ